MGVVYKAEDVRLHRLVALKCLSPELTQDPVFEARFQREARTASVLNHPNICTIYDVGEDHGMAFIAMELLVGSTLSDRITGCPIPIDTVLSLAVDIAAGLEAAHGKGIIHRDIKPANIFVVNGVHAKILDFGLAKLSGTRRRVRRRNAPDDTREVLTRPGSTVGTIAYMSPEQARGEELDERTDLFSFGAVLYEMVTGKSPFQGNTSALIFDAIFNQEPPLPSSANPFLPVKLEEVIGKALAKDRAARYQHATEIRSDLRALWGEANAPEISGVKAVEPPVASVANPIPEPSSVRRESLSQALDFPPSTIEIPRANAAPQKNFRRILAVSAMLTVILAAGIAAYFWRYREQKSAARLGGVSIAVLPFVNLSPQEEDYFSDGLTEQLINNLARVPGAKVVARSSAFKFKGKNEDVREVGRELGVAHVLEGSVRREGRRLRITSELINTEDGFQLWSQTYDRTVDDIFAVQDQIANSVISALKMKLLQDGDSLNGNSRITNADAYQAYLQGKYLNGRGQAKQDLEKALAYTDRALSLDLKYAPAWAQRSYILATMGAVGAMDNADAYRRARYDAEKAISLDPGLSAGYSALALVQIGADWDWEGADASLNKAATLAPGDVDVLNHRAYLLRIRGRLDESIEIEKQAVASDPLRARSILVLGNLLFYAGRYDEANAAVQKALDLNPESSAAHAIRGMILMSQGHLQQGLAETKLEPSDWGAYTGESIIYYALKQYQDSDLALKQLIATHQNDCAFQIAEVYAYRQKPDDAFQWLNRAYQQRDSGLRDVQIDPLLKPLHKDPRFDQLLRKMRLDG